MGLAVLAATSYFVHQFLWLFQFRRLHPEPPFRGSPAKGVRYAFGRGLMPGEKESTRRHVFIYVVGIIYHAAILVAFIRLAFLGFGLGLPAGLRSWLIIILIIGFSAGIFLLFRRLLSPSLRGISLPDDYGANILVDLFLVMAFLSLIKANAVPVFLVLSIVLILYLPVGKIRHCLLFFPSRYFFGRYFGSRGVLPPVSGLTKEKKKIEA